MPPFRVVVVGAGIAGMGAALGLASRGARVTLVDAAPRLGGACQGFAVDLPGHASESVDLGVSDFNRATFVRLAALMGELALPLTPVCQDASFRTPQGRWLWSSSPLGVEVAPGVDPRFARDIARFKAQAPRQTDAGLSVGAWLRAHGYTRSFSQLYVAPRALGCFASPDVPTEALPMRALARFWGMHGLVGSSPADRVCVRGGMHRYLPALQARLQALGVRLCLGDGVRRIERTPMAVQVLTAGGALTADRLVLALPPAAALRLLTEPTAAEQAVLSACRTQQGRVVLHGDMRLMPSDRSHWAAYNYVVPGRERVPGPTITFYPQRLARLAGRLPPLFVTLNPHIEPRDALAERVFTHPVLGRDDTMPEAIAQLQGTRRTWFCGAWTAEPFLHEQGLASGLDVAAAMAAPMALAA